MLCLRLRSEKRRAQLRVRFQRVISQKAIVIEEERRCQNSLSITFLKQIARRLRCAPKRVFRVGLLPRLELGSCFHWLQLVGFRKRSPFQHDSLPEK